VSDKLRALPSTGLPTTTHTPHVNIAFVPSVQVQRRCWRTVSRPFIYAPRVRTTTLLLENIGVTPFVFETPVLRRRHAERAPLRCYKCPVSSNVDNDPARRCAIGTAVSVRPAAVNNVSCFFRRNTSRAIGRRTTNAGVVFVYGARLYSDLRTETVYNNRTTDNTGGTNSTRLVVRKSARPFSNVHDF